jgi:AraC family transcriptional regulator
MTRNPDYQLHRNWVQRIVNHIEDTLGTPHELPHLAGMAQLSLPEFQEIFLNVTGYAAAEYIRHIRSERAALLLSRCRDLSVPDISVETGFDSPKAFGQAFYAHFGMSADQWRDGDFWLCGGRYWDWRRGDERRRLQALGRGRIAGDQRMYYTDDAMADAADGKRPACVANIQVKTLPAFRVAYMYLFGALTKSRWQSIRQCVKRWGLLNHDTVAIVRCHSNPTVTPADRLRYDVGLVVGPEVETSPDVAIQHYAAGEYLAVDFEGPVHDGNLMWEYLCQHYMGRQPLRERPGWKFTRVPLAQACMPWVPDTQRVISAASAEIVRYQECLPIQLLATTAPA